MSDVMDRTFEALANTQRRAIIHRLLDGPLETPTLGGHFDMSKQALHQHLAVLERAGLIERRPVGRVHRIHLRPEPLGDVTNWATTVQRAWSSSLDRLGDLLERTAAPGEHGVPDAPSRCGGRSAGEVRRG